MRLLFFTSILLFCAAFMAFIWALKQQRKGIRIRVTMDTRNTETFTKIVSAIRGREILYANYDDKDTVAIVDIWVTRSNYKDLLTKLKTIKEAEVL